MPVSPYQYLLFPFQLSGIQSRFTLFFVYCTENTDFFLFNVASRQEAPNFFFVRAFVIFIGKLSTPNNTSSQFTSHFFLRVEQFRFVFCISLTQFVFSDTLSRIDLVGRNYNHPRWYVDQKRC
jgi:hypothetical protein